MSSTVTYNYEPVTKTYNPRASVKAEIEKECFGQKVAEITNKDGSFNVKYLTANTKVGTNEWLVKFGCGAKQPESLPDEYTSEKTDMDDPDDDDHDDGKSSDDRRFLAIELKVRNLQISVASLEKSIGWLTENTAKPFVQNIACQVVLFLCGAQPQDPAITKPSTRYKKPTGSLMKAIDGITNDADCTLSKSHFLRISDDIIDRRNASFHYACVQTLEVEVKKGLDAFSSFPDLYNKCRDERSILENFDVIKKYLPK